MFRSKFFLALFLFLFVFQQAVFAEFRLNDAIKEFGEKRYVETTPTHIKSGPLKIHPRLRTQASYSDNILHEDKDGKEDVIFNVIPGAILELPINKHQLAIGYEADFENFVKRTDQNNQNQNFFALANLHFPDWYINILEQLRHTTDRSGTTFTERIPRVEQSINPKIGYRWNRTVFETGYRHTLRHFQRTVDQVLDFQIHEWSGVIYYDLFARLKALLNYDIAHIGYDKNNSRNALVHQIRAGVQGEVLPNVFIDARIGPQLRNYGASSQTDFYSWVAKASVDYKWRENWKFNVNFSREPVEATFENINYFLEHAWGGGIEYKIRPRWILFNEEKLKRQSYAGRASSGGFRKDLILSSKTGVRYLINEYIQLEAAYQLLHRHSNFSTSEYTENLATLMTELSY